MSNHGRTTRNPQLTIAAPPVLSGSATGTSLVSVQADSLRPGRLSWSAMPRMQGQASNQLSGNRGHLLAAHNGGYFDLPRGSSRPAGHARLAARRTAQTH